VAEGFTNKLAKQDPVTLVVVEAVVVTRDLHIQEEMAVLVLSSSVTSSNKHQQAINNR
jgi:hypothetical protein